MYWRLVCLLGSGKPLTARTSTILFHAARELVRREERAHIFRTDDAEGEVKTRFENASLGTFSGIVFTAEIGTAEGTTKVKFIVEEQTLRDEREILDEDLQFLPLNPQAAGAANWN